MMRLNLGCACRCSMVDVVHVLVGGHVREWIPAQDKLQFLQGIILAVVATQGKSFRPG